MTCARTDAHSIGECVDYTTCWSCGATAAISSLSNDGVCLACDQRRNDFHEFTPGIDGRCIRLVDGERASTICGLGVAAHERGG